MARVSAPSAVRITKPGRPLIRTGSASGGTSSQPLPAEAGDEPQDLVAAVDRVERRVALAAAVGVEHRVLGEQLREAGEVAALQGGVERAGEPRGCVGAGREPRALVAHVVAAAGGELAARGLGAIEDLARSG